jgi:hypothetical protein
MSAPKRWSPSLVAVLVVVLLAACGGSPPTPPATGLDLEGLWRVTPGPTTTYGAGGTTTVRFGAASSGSATYLSRSDANGITDCERHVYAAIGGDVVLLDGTYYVATAVNADRISLDNGTDAMTLDRVAGTPPVAPCAEAEATVVATFDFGTGSFTGLNAYQTRLYMNTDAASDPIVAYDTATGVLGAARVYSQSVSGGTHRWVVGARSDDLFFGHCGCGGSTSVNAFNLATDASISVAEVPTDLGVNMGIRYGYFDGGSLVIGGRNRDESGVNELLTLDPDTLALLSRRQVLPEASIQDVTLRSGQLLALVDGAVVVVGADGRAASTIELTGAAVGYVRGLTHVGGTVYALGEDATGDAVLYRVVLP